MLLILIIKCKERHCYCRNPAVGKIRLKSDDCWFYAMGLCYFAENNGDGRTDEEKHLQNTRTGKSS